MVYRELNVCLFLLETLTLLALPLGTSHSCPSFKFLHLSGVISSLRSDAVRLDETRMIYLLVVSQNSLNSG